MDPEVESVARMQLGSEADVTEDGYEHVVVCWFETLYTGMHRNIMLDVTCG